MINVDKKMPDDDKFEILSQMIWKSSIFALIFTVPALVIFLGIYYTTGNLIIGAVLGFGVHFVTLAFSGKISKRLVKFQKNNGE